MLLRLQMPTGQKFNLLQIAVFAAIVVHNQNRLVQANTDRCDFSEEKPTFWFIANGDKLVNGKGVAGFGVELSVSRSFCANGAPRKQVYDSALILPIGIELGQAVSGAGQTVINAAGSAPSGNMVRSSAGDVELGRGGRETSFHKSADFEGARKSLFV